MASLIDCRRFASNGLNLLKVLYLAGLMAGHALAQTPSAIYVMRVDGSQVRKVADAPEYNSVGHARWSRDGKRLSFHGWDGPNGSRRIFVADANGLRPAEAGPNGQLPDWSPDDKQLAFQTPGDDGDEAGVWVANLDGTGGTLLAGGSSLRWSPDAARLAFINDSEKEIIVRDLVNETEDSLMDSPWDGIRPGLDWSPDGRQIAFVARRNGVLGLWITDVTNPQPRMRLEGNMLGHVAWSPDGKQLAITLNRSIQLLDVAGVKPPQPIPGQVGASRDPAWSPDGKSIGFTSTRAAPRQDP